MLKGNQRQQLCFARPFCMRCFLFHCDRVSPTQVTESKDEPKETLNVTGEDTLKEWINQDLQKITELKKCQKMAIDGYVLPYYQTITEYFHSSSNEIVCNFIVVDLANQKISFHIYICFGSGTKIVVQNSHVNKQIFTQKAVFHFFTIPNGLQQQSHLSIHEVQLLWPDTKPVDYLLYFRQSKNLDKHLATREQSYSEDRGSNMENPLIFMALSSRLITIFFLLNYSKIYNLLKCRKIYVNGSSD